MMGTKSLSVNAMVMYGVINCRARKEQCSLGDFFLFLLEFVYFVSFGGVDIIWILLSIIWTYHILYKIP